MNLALGTIIALVVSFIVGTVFDVNIGVLCLAFGFIASLLAGGTGAEIISGVNQSTFVLMVGLLLLFTIANKNKTILKLCNKLLRLVNGKAVIMPFAFAIIGMIVCGVGAGGIAATAMLCGTVASMAKQAKINPVLMSNVSLHGIFAGHFWPTSAIGAALLVMLPQMGIEGLSGKIMWANIIVQFLGVVLSFLLFGGLDMFKNKETFTVEISAEENKFDTFNWITIVFILLFVLNILVFKFDNGLVCILLGVLLTIIGKKYGIKEGEIFKAIPWSTVIMLIGVFALITAMSDAGGTQLIVGAIQNLNLGSFGFCLIFIVAGLISYFATSAPVILACLPLALQLANAMGKPELVGGAVVGVCICAVIVDVSPLSNNGALMLTQISGLEEDSDAAYKRYYKPMLAYGGLQIIVSALFCWLAFILLGI